MKSDKLKENEIKKYSDQSGPVKEKKRTTLGRLLLRIFLIIILSVLGIIIVAVVALYVYEPQPAPGFAFSSAGNTIKLSDGRTLAYLDSGDPEGRPVFYFHGGPGSRLQGLLFDELNKKLGIRMISTDRPGYGLSDFQENRTYIDWPDDIRELSDHLGIDRFAVMGWSSGGPYAAAVAHGIPERLTVAVIVAGEGPYANEDFPQGVVTEDIFKLFLWSANNGPWLMRTLFKIQRIMFLTDPVGVFEDTSGFDMSVKDIQFFTQDFRREIGAEMVEAFRRGVDGMTRDFVIERIDWPFELEEIHSPKVLVFHGDEDTMVHPKIGVYVSKHIPSCDEITIFPGEGHSIMYYRYEDIIRAMLEAWE